MSRSDVRRALTSSQAEPLQWEVFVTPGIPIAQAERPQGVKQTYFQAMASTLIYGQRDAVLVDAFMTVAQASALADWVAAKKKEADEHLHHTWPRRPLVWSGHHPQAIPKRQGRCDVEYDPGNAGKCVSAGSRGVEGGISGSDS